MKQFYLFLLLPFLLLTRVSFGQQTFRTTPTSVIGFLEYLPANYAQNSDKYPVVIFLHGLGEKGPNTTDIATLQKNINLVARNGPPKLVNNGTQFPFILISPQLKSNYGDWQSWYVLEVIDYCKTYLRIDERRIYLTGLSLGGGGTWWTAQDFPKLFAAIAPVCGSRNSPSKACLLTAENLPVWGFHGDADGTVPLARTVNMIAAINKCLPLPNPLAKITIYPGIGHDAWDNAYRNDHTLHNPNVYEWMLSYTNTINGTNKIPIANAGLDIVKSLPVNSVTLTSTSTDSDGKIASVSWKQLSGPSQTVFASTASTSSSLQVSGLAQGVYVFQLDVTDNLGDSDCDYVKITIAAPPTNTNMPPVTSAGPDRIIKLPSATNTLFGSAYDPDGKIISYKWVQVSGPACTLSSNSVSRPKISNLTSGTYVFRLTSYDDNGVSSSDDVTVTADFPPVAKAGADITFQLSTSPLQLKGSGTDSDGSITSYVWAKDSGPTAVLTDKNTPTVTISKLEAGTYVFRLTVKDDAGVSSSDYATVIVLPLINGRDSTTTADVSNEDKLILTDTDNLELVNSKIIVYNDLGQKIHEGPWTPELYSEIFNRRGLYIFHLITSKGRKTGKIYVTENE